MKSNTTTLFAAKGLIDIASKIIDNNLDINYPREALKSNGRLMMRMKKMKTMNDF